LKKQKDSEQLKRHAEWLKRWRLMRERRNQLKASATPAEKKIRQILYSLGIRHQFQKAFFLKWKRLFIVDFYLPQYKLAIEVDGSHHQSDLKQQDYDEYRTNLLELKRDLRVVRFTNQDVLYNTGYVVNRIKDMTSFRG
jgi:very-short-patch-repair endonuclease